MKKWRVIPISILFATLCLVVTACTQGLDAGKGAGTVQVVIGGGAVRSVGANGLPEFDDTNTKIIVTDEAGAQLAQGTTSVTLSVDIGKKITVEATITTAAGIWRGSAEHTVTKGANTVAVKLSKTPKDVASLMFSITGKAPSGSNIVSLSTKTGKKLLDGILISSAKPVTARDNIGRIYMLYEDASSTLFRRFDIEGTKDTSFETAITSKLPSGVNISNIKTIAIDAKNNYIFLFNGDTVYCFKEKEDHSFESFGSAVFPITAVSVNITAAAAYDNVLFVVYGATLYACKFEFEAASGHPGAQRLKFESTASSKSLDKLRTDTAFSNHLTECTGLFADANGVYCLLKQQELHHGNIYAVGQLVRYTYSGSTLTGETKIGLHSKAGASDSSLAFEAGAFVNPIGFIGYDEENIYIADDGANIDEVNENLHLNGNKNRIAAFNRKTNAITFKDTEATWYEEHSAYKLPETKILLWGKDSNNAFRYWTSADGTDTYSSDNTLFASSLSEKLTDVFCYDQDGNLYILWNNGSANKVRRFALKADGSYEKAAAQDLNLGTSDTVDAIAVDVSNGKNYLYYYTETPTNKKIERFKWEVFFYSGSKDTAYTITLPSGKVTALAANKDGVFVATKEQTTPSISPYTLKIKKYTKDTGAPLGEKTIATHEGGDNPPTHSASDYTNSNGTVCGLQVIEGVLYALRQNIEKEEKYDSSAMGHAFNEFRSSGVLYKVGQTASTFTGSYDKEFKKEFIDPLPSAPPGTKDTGYGFYRFIAVKPKKLIIASDGAWGKDGALVGSGSPKYQDTDKVLEYDLAGALQHERNSGGSFSKKLRTDASGFLWQ